MTWRPAARDVVILGAAVAQVVLPATLPPRVRARLDAIVPDVVQPTNATFTIWLPIFASSLALPTRQLLPQTWRSTAVDDLGWGPAAPFASTALWALCIRTERYRAAQLALFSIALTAELTRRRLASMEVPGQLDNADWFIAAPATSMLAGWGAAASGVNLAALIATELPVTEPKARRALAAVAVSGLGALAAASGRATSPARVSTRWYTATVLWALAGIAARRPTDPLLAALSTAAALTVWRRTHPQ
jgi:hypothetical protein